MKIHLQILALFLFLSSYVIAQDIPYNEEVYQNRLNDYRQNNYNNGNKNTLPLQAFLKQPIDQVAVTEMFNTIPTNGEFDFYLVQLLRVLFLSDGQYESEFLPKIQPISLWLTPNENTRVYWTENHITMWLSSQWLLHEKYDWTADAGLREKVIHCLDLKIEHGFYEFLSTVYFPYTLSGLLNLADFSEDEEIREKAKLAANRLLKEVLMVTNDKGVFYPASGRNYPGKFATPYGQNHNDLIYLLTGLGEASGTSHAAAFLATSTLDVSDIVNSWKEKESTFLTMGHPLNETNAIHEGLQPLDKTMFQWSAGIYFHPDFALETATLIDGYNLWDHKEFSQFSFFKGIPVGSVPGLTKFASSISKSTVLTGAKVAIYKNKSITLSSIQDFWKGLSGYQQWPWVATTGILPVYTQSGKGGNLFVSKAENANSNLPYIKQVDNVALIMYRPKKDLKSFGLDNHDVTLVWQDSLYDEVTEYGKWVIAREGDSYIAVLRHCIDRINGAYTCDDQDGQLWSCVVGNQDMYGSFENFVNKVQKTKHQEKWTLDTKKWEWHYYGLIEFDGNRIEYDWIDDLLSVPGNSSTDPLVTSTRTLLESNSISIYPNPAQDKFTLNWNRSEAIQDVSLLIFDVSGKIVAHQSIDVLPNSKVQVPLNGISAGIYQVILKTDIGIITQKLVVQ